MSFAKKLIMKKFLLVLWATFVFINLLAQKELHPVLKSFGALYDVPFATIRADSTMEYKIVIEFRQAIENPKDLHPFFEHIGRMYNLHIYDRVPQKNLHVAVVIFGPASECVLNNAAYRAKFKTDNPNLKVFEEFRNAGVRVLVCGQSLVLHEINPAAITSSVEISSSRYTAVSTFQMKGYALFQMN